MEKTAFKAETRQLLDIVTNSIYTDSEVYVRELISNGSDSLEKLRHLKVSNDSSLKRSSGSEGVKITSEGGVVTIEDGGIGMTREELEVNLGTIARSGSREFVSEGKDADGDIIGKFGVGFYSAFMVGERVEVHSKSVREEGGGHTWKSDGGGEFEIVEGADEDLERGCRIKIFLKEDEKDSWGKERLGEVIKKYSNFVNFPITLNGEEVNTVEAVWSKMPSDVTEETHKEFYRFVSGAFDEPMYKLHYRADAPLDIKALLYVPKFHTEKYGMGRMEKGVSLYSRKVLIESKSDVMPEWLRFVKGVVDCEDLPLSISREKAQDSRLVAKLRQATTRRLVSELEKFKRKEGDKFRKEFWPEFGHFIKEGVCQDYQFQSQLSKLLHFESSKSPSGDLTTLEEYVSRMEASQKEIYYLVAPSREVAERSPYMEAFEGTKSEVLFVYSAIDDFVMSNLDKFEDRKLRSVEDKDLDLGGEGKEGEDGEESEGGGKGLSKEDAAEMCAWLTATLGGGKVSTVKVTGRLGSSPAIVTNHESGAMRRMMRMVDTQGGATGGLDAVGPQELEVNPEHPLIVGLKRIKGEEGREDMARELAEQIFDNAMVQAGIMDDPRSMVGRVNKIMEHIVKEKEE